MKHALAHTVVAALIASLGLPACRAAAPVLVSAAGPPRAAGEPLQVGFLLVDGVYQSELIAPYDVLHHTVFQADPGMQVFTVAPTLEPVRSFEGIRYLPHHDFSDHPRIDVLVVPSAEGSMDGDLKNRALVEWVRRVGGRAERVMSLCDGAFLLAAAGLLDGLESTTFPGDIEAYRERFPELLVHEGVSFVHHGKAITSAGGAKSYDPALYLAELLYGAEAARGIGRGLVIDWNVADVDHLVVE